MGLLRRWLSHSLALALGLICALLAMQAPALTHDDMAALLQVGRAAQRDIDERIATARRFYAIADDDEDGVVKALAAVEPANAESLAQSIAHARRLDAAYRRLEETPPLLRPIIALGDVITEEGRDRAAISSTLFETFEPQISLTLDAGVYALIGLLLGMLAAQLLLAVARAAARLAFGPSRETATQRDNP
ncbi:MAG TPA: DUF2937 family protein [Stellaceae bacterium]|nr:DUF2937 family protein [Stellaceae bacterium]